MSVRDRDAEARSCRGRKARGGGLPLVGAFDVNLDGGSGLSGDVEDNLVVSDGGCMWGMLSGVRVGS